MMIYMDEYDERLEMSAMALLFSEPFISFLRQTGLGHHRSCMYSLIVERLSS